MAIKCTEFNHDVHSINILYYFQNFENFTCFSLTKPPKAFTQKAECVGVVTAKNDNQQSH